MADILRVKSGAAVAADFKGSEPCLVLDFDNGDLYSIDSAGNVVQVNAGGGGGVTDHGLLTGLGDDDHPQYLTQTEADALYAALSHGEHVAANGISDAELRDSSACTVIGRSANSSGDPADIAAAGNDVVLRRTGDTLNFGQLTVGMLPNDLVTYAKIQNVAGFSVFGKATTGSGDGADITAGADSVLGRSGGGDLAFGTIVTNQISNDAVTYGKIQNVTDARLLGRSAGSSGDCQEITVGSGLSLSGGALTATGGGSSPWTLLKQTADDSKTDNALASSTFLTVALSAATHYTIRGVAYILVQNASADARFDINFTGTWTTVYCVDVRNVAGVAAGTDARTDRVASALPGSTDMTATVTGICVVEFEINGLVNGAGTLSFRFAQVTNNASATLLKRGSYMEYMSA